MFISFGWNIDILTLSVSREDFLQDEVVPVGWEVGEVVSDCVVVQGRGVNCMFRSWVCGCFCGWWSEMGGCCVVVAFAVGDSPIVMVYMCLCGCDF